MSMASDCASTGFVFLMFSSKQLKPTSMAINVFSGFCCSNNFSIIGCCLLLKSLSRIAILIMGFVQFNLVVS